MEPKMSMIPSGVPSADVSQQTNKIVPKLENPSPSPINQTTTTLPPISVAPITIAYPVAAMPLFPVLATAPTPVAVTDPMVGAGGGTGMGTEGLGKKVRGRPRKYGPDGKLNVALAPTPISSVPLPGSGDSSAWKRCGGKPLGTNVKMSPPKFEDEPETGFMVHVLNIAADEDISMKIMSFSQTWCRAVVVLSAVGSISNVTLRQGSGGGTLTYEGGFEILTLSGSYIPAANGGTKSTVGGMTVTLAARDGRLFGGGVAGFLIAAGNVQVLLGSFLPNDLQEEQILKKPRMEPSVVDSKGSNGGTKPTMTASANPGDDSASPDTANGC